MLKQVLEIETLSANLSGNYQYDSNMASSKEVRGATIYVANIVCGLSLMLVMPLAFLTIIHLLVHHRLNHVLWSWWIPFNIDL